MLAYPTEVAERVEAVAFQLGDIEGWTEGLSCTPTALAGLSGKTPKQIGIMLSEIAIKNGRSIGPELRETYNVNDWLEVVNRLGGSWRRGITIASFLSSSDLPLTSGWRVILVSSLSLCSAMTERKQAMCSQVRVETWLIPTQRASV
jgi:hypothetical protein